MYKNLMRLIKIEFFLWAGYLSNLAPLQSKAVLRL